MVPIGLPEFCLVDIDERDNEIKRISRWVKAWISGNAAQRRRMQRSVVKIRSDYQIALMLRSHGGEEDYDV